MENGWVSLPLQPHSFAMWLLEHRRAAMTVLPCHNGINFCRVMMQAVDGSVIPVAENTPEQPGETGHRT